MKGQVGCVTLLGFHREFNRALVTIQWTWLHPKPLRIEMPKLRCMEQQDTMKENNTSNYTVHFGMGFPLKQSSSH